MCFKNALIILLFPFVMYSQLKVDDVASGWKDNIYKAINIVKTHDVEKYNVLVNECTHIGYWLGNYSTTEGNSTILIPKQVMEAGNINNLAATLVHESMHLQIARMKKENGIIFSDGYEERLCYSYELNFLNKIPFVETWLVNHAVIYENLYSRYLY